jgi:hypothetical protein
MEHEINDTRLKRKITEKVTELAILNADHLGINCVNIISIVRVIEYF